jgi:hypothetical protein
MKGRAFLPFLTVPQGRAGDAWDVGQIHVFGAMVNAIGLHA